MAGKNPIQKLQEAVVGTVSGVVADPKGSVGKAAGQVRGVVSLGLTVAGQVAGQVADRLSGGSQPEPPPYGTGRPDLRVAEPAEPKTEASADEPTADDGPEVAAKPTDVARVVAKKGPPPRKSAPSTPSDKLPPRKEPAEKAPAKKAAAKKAPAKKSPAKKSPAKKSPAKKAPATEAAPPPAAEPLLDPALTKAVASEAEIGARAADPDKG